MNIKKTLILALAVLTLTASLTACGSKSSDSSTASGDTGHTAEPVHVTVGVTGAVHEQIWAPAIETLKEEGIDLELVQFSDYTLPNNALANGDIDLNAFQHHLYLDAEIENYGYEITKIPTSMPPI